MEALRVCHLPSSRNEVEAENAQFQYLALSRYCQTSYRTRNSLLNALKITEKDLAKTKNIAAEQHAKIISLQYENETLRLAAQQVCEVKALREEVARLQHLEREQDQFNADLEAFRRLKVDVHNLDTFRKHKVAIFQYMKLIPKLTE